MFTKKLLNFGIHLKRSLIPVYKSHPQGTVRKPDELKVEVAQIFDEELLRFLKSWLFLGKKGHPTPYDPASEDLISGSLQVDIF